MKTGRRSLRDRVAAALPGTRAELTEKAGVGSATVGKWLAILRAENEAHIGSWLVPDFGVPRPVFVAGPGVDAKAPEPLTSTEYSRRYTERHPERRAAAKSSYYFRKTKPGRTAQSSRRKGWFAALIFNPVQRF